MNRVTSKNKPWTPGESDMVCSIHFVDGCPTPVNPVPTLHLGYEAVSKKPRRVLIRAVSNEKPALSGDPATSEAHMDIVMEEDSAREGPSCTNCYDATLKVLLLEEEVQSLEAENRRLQQKVNALSSQLLYE